MQTVMIDHPDHASDFHATFYSPVNPSRMPATGYGSKIPTTRMIRYMGRSRRIYVDQYSNAGRTYIMINNEKITVR